MTYYPIFLDLRHRRCVVVGGGREATNKVKNLLQAGALVKIIAPTLTQELKELVEAGQIEHVSRDYRPGDLADAFLIVSEKGDLARNEAVWREANDVNAPVNVVDDTGHSSFIAPSIVRRGDLTVAISTSGKAPALAVRLRQRLEKELGPEYARFLELAGQLRAQLTSSVPDFEERKTLWYRLVDSEVLGLLRHGDETTARRRIGEILGHVQEPSG